MTAIWNNFDNGSKSLEHYADVITALGAATASSSEEISKGMQKFAAIGNTVGLSYEYAASALATVTAETRQSADVVGTAFKTIFARMEGLNLGETLEDGTDLNKYSQALATVGVQIKDTNGEMKSMDTILDEMGNRW
jgi:TP901 family phage tail tape measure protein